MVLVCFVFGLGMQYGAEMCSDVVNVPAKSTPFAALG